jgi:predicted RNA-binding protein with PIN domain
MPPARHLLVNGANILHAWPELRRLLTRDRDAARRPSVKVAALHGTSEKAWRR